MSRPSIKACTRAGTLCSRAIFTRASRWLTWLCTPPSESNPIKWRRPPWARTASHSARIAGFLNSEPSSIARSMRVISWYTTRPAPIFRCPTSELPIKPSGKPTSRPEAESDVTPGRESRRSSVGVQARDMAFPGPAGARPKPSRISSNAGVTAFMIHQRYVYDAEETADGADTVPGSISGKRSASRHRLSK